MKRRDLIVCLAVLAACSLALVWGTAAVAEEGESVNLEGEIEAADYDDDGKVSSVLLYDDEWGVVLIDANGEGKKLLQQLGAVVQIQGKIVELDDDSGYSYAIHVASYKVVKPALASKDQDQDWDSDDED